MGILSKLLSEKETQIALLRSWKQISPGEVQQSTLVKHKMRWAWCFTPVISEFLRPRQEDHLEIEARLGYRGNLSSAWGIAWFVVWNPVSKKKIWEIKNRITTTNSRQNVIFEYMLKRQSWFSHGINLFIHSFFFYFDRVTPSRAFEQQWYQHSVRMWDSISSRLQSLHTHAVTDSLRSWHLS